MRPALQLPDGVRVADVANASRLALDEFLALDPQDTRLLSSWFAGPYHRAVSFAGRRAASSDARTASHSPIPELVANAQATIGEAILAASKPGAEGLVAMLPSIIDVIPIRDVFGVHGFAPVNQAHARLAIRVLTLLVADYLTRPDDYLAYGSRRPTLRSIPGRAPVSAT
jgi:hypothetical protein